MNAVSCDSHSDRAGNWVGPVLRVGDLAESVALAIAEDNPGRRISILDRGDYVRIHTEQTCRLTRQTLERQLGHPFELRLLETEMPSFAGRLETRADEYVWYYRNS